MYLHYNLQAWFIPIIQNMRESRLLDSNCLSKNSWRNFFSLHYHSNSVFYLHTASFLLQLYVLNVGFTKILITTTDIQK